MRSCLHTIIVSRHNKNRIEILLNHEMRNTTENRDDKMATKNSPTIIYLLKHSLGKFNYQLKSWNDPLVSSAQREIWHWLTFVRLKP